MQWCFENSNMQWENFKSQEKQIWQKIKYEISTDLPSARARRFESDEWDLSPALTYHCSARPGEVDEDELSTLRHTFLDRLLLFRVVVGTSGCGSGEPQSACPSLSHEALLFPLLELEKHVLLSDAEMDFSPSYVDPCIGGP